jgi:hypothetical protein
MTNNCQTQLFKTSGSTKLLEASNKVLQRSKANPFSMLSHKYKRIEIIIIIYSEATNLKDQN